MYSVVNEISSDGYCSSTCDLCSTNVDLLKLFEDLWHLKKCQHFILVLKVAGVPYIYIFIREKYIFNKCIKVICIFNKSKYFHYVCIKVKLDVLCLVPQSVFVRAVRCSPTACRLVLTPARLLVLRRRVSVGTSVWGGVSVSRVCTCTRVSVCDGTTVPASTDVTATAQETPSDSAATPGESNISVLTETTGDCVLRFLLLLFRLPVCVTPVSGSVPERSVRLSAQ